jgi:hypothetical protein
MEVTLQAWQQLLRKLKEVTSLMDKKDGQEMPQLLTLQLFGQRTSLMGIKFKASLSRKEWRDIVQLLLKIKLLSAWFKSKYLKFINYPIFSGNIELKDVFVPDFNRLAKADDFEKGLNTMLMLSRLTITWIFAGAMSGAFEAAYHYSMKRI